MEKIKMAKVVRVDKNEFELEDGQIFQHPIPLDEIPTIEEFQEIYKKWVEILNKEIENQ